jgi:hypothetical protein
MFAYLQHAHLHKSTCSPLQALHVEVVKPRLDFRTDILESEWAWYLEGVDREERQQQHWHAKSETKYEDLKAAWRQASESGDRDAADVAEVLILLYLFSVVGAQKFHVLRQAEVNLYPLAPEGDEMYDQLVHYFPQVFPKLQPSSGAAPAARTQKQAPCSDKPSWCGAEQQAGCQNRWVLCMYVCMGSSLLVACMSAACDAAHDKLVLCGHTTHAGAQPVAECETVWDGGFADKPRTSAELSPTVVKLARQFGLKQLPMPGEGKSSPNMACLNSMLCGHFVAARCCMFSVPAC